MNNMNFLYRSLPLILFAALCVSSCSNDGAKDAQNEESYQTRSADIGREAAETIRVPMENTRDAVDMENERMREYEKRLNE